ncbi:MAG: class I SAM-dependent methyltransferase [Magnetococcus sp. DMHC-6]
MEIKNFFHHPPIFLFAEEQNLLARAQELATTWGIPMGDVVDISQAKTDHHFFLLYTPERLELHRYAPSSLERCPVYVQFISEKEKKRVQQAGRKQEPLARAAALSGNTRPHILDATPGFGRDAFLLATLGCHLHLVERSPVVASLLADGLARAKHGPTWTKEAVERMRLTCADARQHLTLNHEKIDVVYLDPMYPERKKTALVKKEMRWLRDLVGTDADAEDLLHIALQRAANRVVVKRPQVAPPLPGPQPNFAIHAPNTRFDIYLSPLLKGTTILKEAKPRSKSKPWGQSPRPLFF